MKITEIVKNESEKFNFSFEIMPPLKGSKITSIFNNIEPITKLKPKFINVTYHREEHKYIEVENGLLKRIVIRKRPGTLGLCSAIQSKYNIDAIPHVLCGGFSKDDTENLLIEMQFLGIDNVMALRGDAIRDEIYFKPNKDGHSFAHQLVNQIVEMNNGKYIETETKYSSKSDFCIGVAAYPEKHIESPSLESDIYFLKNKIQRGANFIITQMFFDNSKYFDFVQKCREREILVPIIPGIKPITSKNQLSLLPHRFFVSLPQELIDNILAAKDDKEVVQVGIKWAINQCENLIENGINHIHFYTMSQSKNIETIIKTLKNKYC